MAEGMHKHEDLWMGQAELYAAGALTPEERANFEAHLAAGCDACGEEVGALGKVAAALAAALPPQVPDPRVKAELMSRIAGEAVSREAASPLLRHFAAEAFAASGLVVRRAAGAVWEATDVPGVLVRTLFVDRDKDQFTALVRMAPGASYPPHTHAAAEECLVLEGELRVGDDVLRAGDYQRAAAGSRHPAQNTDAGCLLLITSSLCDIFE